MQTNQQMACVMSQKLLRERHRTAKHLRKYYLKCLDQLLHADFDRLVAVNFECLTINICIESPEIFIIDVVHAFELILV